MSVVSLMIPNLLTICRLISGPLFLLFGRVPASPVPLLALTLAALTDLVDGRLARALGSTSALGAVLDTTSDKIFALSLALKLAQARVMPWWMFYTLVVQYMLLALEGSIFVRKFGLVPTPDSAAHLSALLAALTVLTGLVSTVHTHPRWLGVLTIIANCVHLASALRRVLAPTAQ